MCQANHENQCFNYLVFGSKRNTYNHTSDAVAGITAPFKVLRDNREDTRRKGHVKQAISLRSALLNFLEVLVELMEGVILVVLS